jgi:hypothetical protein
MAHPAILWWLLAINQGCLKSYIVSNLKTADTAISLLCRKGE